MKFETHITRVLLSLAFFTALCASAAAQTKPKATEIHFIEDAWGEALKQAALQHKYVFVDAYATWCGPCKMLKATTFKDKKAADFYNQNFVNVSLDMEKGDGPQLAQQWRIDAYPTLIIFSPKGKPVLGTVGYLDAGDLLKFGKAALAKKVM